MTADFLSRMIIYGRDEIRILHDSLSSGERNGNSRNLIE